MFWKPIFPATQKEKRSHTEFYDVHQNQGYMVIGVSHETSAFAISSIRSWGLEVGQKKYKGSNQLMIQADSGGANAKDSWLWKAGLQSLADEFRLEITVMHFPAGASKWNLIEHRMFSVISLNWAGQPLDRYETMLKFISTSKKITGFRCLTHFDRRKYQTGLKVQSDEKQNLNIHFHRRFPNWNYTIKPHSL